MIRRTLAVTALVLMTAQLAAAEPTLRRDVLFRAGEGDYASYRIPSVIATAKGTVLAFCEGRRKSASDTGEINVLVRRSTDGGQTFGPPQVVWTDGASTCGNPCPVIDEETGTIWLLLTHNRGQDHERDIISGKAGGTRTVWVTSSTDDGLTWAQPREITADVKRPGWAWYATGPGVGIQIRNGPKRGRLVIPCDYIARGGGPNAGNSHVIYSDDHGATWRLGGEPPETRFNESQIVELEGGRLMLNMRNARVPKGQDQPLHRGVAISDDGGESFPKVWRDEALIEPICQASILRCSWKERGETGRILFSNPASQKRERMTVRASEDDGRTWSVGRVVWEGPSAYSCLVRLPGGEVGLLYECGDRNSYERIELARFPVEWLTAGR